MPERLELSPPSRCRRHLILLLRASSSEQRPRSARRSVHGRSTGIARMNVGIFSRYRSSPELLTSYDTFLDPQSPTTACPASDSHSVAMLTEVRSPVERLARNVKARKGRIEVSNVPGVKLVVSRHFFFSPACQSSSWIRKR